NLLTHRARSKDRNATLPLLHMTAHLLPLAESGNGSGTRALDLDQQLIGQRVCVESGHRVEVGLPLLVVAEAGDLGLELGVDGRQLFIKAAESLSQRVARFLL